MARAVSQVSCNPLATNILTHHQSLVETVSIVGVLALNVFLTTREWLSSICWSPSHCIGQSGSKFRRWTCGHYLGIVRSEEGEMLPLDNHFRRRSYQESLLLLGGDLVRSHYHYH